MPTFVVVFVILLVVSGVVAVVVAIIERGCTYFSLHPIQNIVKKLSDNNQKSITSTMLLTWYVVAEAIINKLWPSTNTTGSIV